jgi:hypothetical protein
MIFLELKPTLQRTDVVTEVKRAGRAVAGQDNGAGSLWWTWRVSWSGTPPDGPDYHASQGARAEGPAAPRLMESMNDGPLL